MMLWRQGRYRALPFTREAVEARDRLPIGIGAATMNSPFRAIYKETH